MEDEKCEDTIDPDFPLLRNSDLHTFQLCAEDESKMEAEKCADIIDSDCPSLKKSDLHTFQLCAQDGKVFNVNSYFLAEFSPVFEKLFFGDFEEAREKKAVLQDETANSIETLLGVLGAREYDTRISVENVPDLLRMASKYDISELFKDCLTFIRLAVCSNACTDKAAVKLLEAVLAYPIPNSPDLKWEISNYLVASSSFDPVKERIWEKIHDSRLVAALVYTCTAPQRCNSKPDFISFSGSNMQQRRRPPPPGSHSQDEQYTRSIDRSRFM